MPEKWEHIEARVTFIVKPGTLDKLREKARQIDTDSNTGATPPETEYTVPQALQVVWHQEPEWLHREVLTGWTLDSARAEGDLEYRHPWEVPE